MIERHHIVFRSQGGLDFDINFIDLTPEEHKGNGGPHLNRKKDLQYKKTMQAELQRTLTQEYYTIHQIIEILGLKEKQAKKAFKKLPQYKEGMHRDDIIFRLMGSRCYE